MKAETLTFEALKYPFHKSYGDQSAIYNTDLYLDSHNTDNLYRLIVSENDRVLGQLNLHIIDGKAINALFSGFGGIEHRLDGQRLSFFIANILQWCSLYDLTSISLKLPPFIYNSNLALTEKILLENHFEVVADEINQYLMVTDQEYQSVIRRNERKRLRKCMEAGFVFRKLDKNQLPEAYDLIRDVRERKGYPVTMTLDGLQKMFLACPNHYFLFGVYDNEKLIATSVSIQVTEQVIYNFYHGDAYSYRGYSPTVMVIEGIYEYCQSNNIDYLDLGISSVDGRLNRGLFEFKRNCGCSSSSKKVLRRDL